MTTPQNNVLSAVKTALEATGLFARVGSFPDDVERLGARFPAALVGDGDQLDYRHLPGRRLQYAYNLDVWLYHDVSTDRRQTMNLLSDAVIGAALTPAGLGASVTNIEALAVEKGEAAASPPDFHNPGVYHHLTVQRVRFAMLLTDTRS
ncbi:MAG: hypothetical protein K8R90_09380 [Candidatus Cloacimonetes bacterium]|nr:hypothetical protein [Candidatus Cloacimonadota bacterium]